MCLSESVLESLKQIHPAIPELALGESYVCVCIKQNSGHKFVWLLSRLCQKEKFGGLNLIYSFSFIKFAWKKKRALTAKKWGVLSSFIPDTSSAKTWAAQMGSHQMQMQNSALQWEILDPRRVHLEAAAGAER